jgi:hypothetical protein
MLSAGLPVLVIRGVIGLGATDVGQEKFGGDDQMTHDGLWRDCPAAEKADDSTEGTQGPTEAQLWRERLMDAAPDEIEPLQEAMTAATVERGRLDESEMVRLLQLELLQAVNPRWTDAAQVLIFADKSALVVGLEDETGCHLVVHLREWSDALETMKRNRECGSIAKYWRQRYMDALNRDAPDEELKQVMDAMEGESKHQLRCSATFVFDDKSAAQIIERIDGKEPTFLCINFYIDHSGATDDKKVA